MPRRDKSSKRVLALCGLVVLICTGCYPLMINDPGGGTVHVPPSSIPAGQPYTVTLECIAISGGANRRFRDGVLHYRLVGTLEYSEIPMKFVTNAGRHPYFSAELPPMPAGVSVEYYVSNIFDGEQRKRYFPAIPVVDPHPQP